MNTLLSANAAEELSESRKNAVEKSSVAIHEIDSEGIIRSVNQAECLLLGYTSTELIGRPVWDFVAPEERDTVQFAVHEKLARSQPLIPLTREYRRADGSYIWLEIRESLIESAAGEVIGIRSALFDITARRTFELAIQREHDRMKFMLRSCTSAIVTADALGHIDFMNPAAETLTGWPQTLALGRPIEAICRMLPDSGGAVDLMSCILAGLASFDLSRQSAIVNRSGECYSVNWTISPICNDNGVIVGATLILGRC
jgi:PAS domain S-box-containing protein